jgi:hypothetical protein
MTAQDTPPPDGLSEGSRGRASVWPYLLMFAVCAGVLVLRAWPRLRHPEIWAEDGLVYLPEALNAGWGSLLISSSSLYPTLARALLVGWTRVLPPSEWPAAVNVTALAITAAVFAIPVSRAYEWLIRDARARAVLCLMFCLLPGLNEMIGNYANLQWPLFFTVAFMGLRDPRDPLPVWAIVLSVACIASMAHAVFAVPLFAWRLFESVRSRRGAAYVWRTAAVIGALGISICALWLAREPEYPRMPGVAPWAMFMALVKTTGESLLLVPLLGDRPAIALSGLSTSWPRALVLIAAFTMLAAGLVRQWRRPAAHAIFVVTLTVVFWPVVSWLVRPANMGPFLIPLNEAALQHRYAFPTAFVAALLWMFLVHTSGASPRWRAGLSLILVVAALGLGTDRLRIRAYGDQLRWERIAWFLERARATGCPNPVVGNIYPGSWTFRYLDRSRPECGAE